MASPRSRVVAVFQPHRYTRTKALFDDFLTACREVIPGSYQEFLNVTLRHVSRDDESWLSYAPVDRIAAVMSFSQEMTERAEADMARMTRDLIDRMIEIGASYYLPYRPHPTVEWPRTGCGGRHRRCGRAVDSRALARRLGRCATVLHLALPTRAR